MITTTPRPLGCDPSPTTVIAALDGDHDAFAELMVEFRPFVHGVVQRVVHRRDLQEEAVQVAFVRAWEHRGQLRDPQRFRPWLARIARNAAIDLVRRQRSVPVDFNAEPTSVPICPDHAPTVAQSNELADRVELGLQQLRRRDAVAITLAAQFGFGPDEIAAALQIRPGNAKVVLHRARKRLRSELGAEWFDAGGTEE